MLSIQKFALGIVTITSLLVSGQQPEERASTTTNRYRPARLPIDANAAARLRVPQGFRVAMFARDLRDPRMLVVADDGTVYVSRWQSDDVVALRDTDGDFVADRMSVVARLDQAHGLEWHAGVLYVASPSEVWAARVTAGQVVEGPVRVISGLPDGGQHENRTVRVGPDGLLYVSVGSSCNDCVESNQLERGTLIRYTPGGQRLDVFAKGLRNTIGYDWHPATATLWGMDNGNDHHGDELPPEELNRIEGGKHYGWPICYGARHVDPMTNDPPEQEVLRPGETQPPLNGITREQFCALTEPSTLTYAAHAAPIAMRFYSRAQFPGYFGDALVTFRGSWNRSVPVGYRVVRIRYAGGVPVGIEDFLTGFLSDDGQSYIGRPTGLAVAPDGSVLVSDDENGVIYRVSYGQ